MSRPIYLGIDPGKGGGMAIIYRGRLVTHSFGKMEDRSTFGVLEALGCEDVFCVLEQVGGFMGNVAGDAGPKQNRGSAHTMFSFGHAAGMVEGFLIALGIPFVKKVPQVWQKAMVPEGERRRKGETSASWKKRLHGMASDLFPQEKFPRAVGDAVLLAVYCRQLHS